MLKTRLATPRVMFFLALTACSAGGATTSSGTGTGGGDGTGASGGAGGATSGPTTTSTTGGSTGSFIGLGGNTTQPGCDAGADEDQDQDGFTITQGDCNDCDANVSPASIEVIPEDGSGGAGGYVPVDEDCDGSPDNVAPPCDDGLALNSSDPMDGARAIELCKQATSDKDWGVVSAQYVRADGTPATANLAVGIEPNWGPNLSPLGGTRMLVLSSGNARLPTDPNACGGISCTNFGTGTAPAGFPQDVPSCSGSTNINDDVGLDLTVRAPKNATSYKFNFDFYSFEYPEWVCTSFNDQFIALVNPAPMGSINGNVSFDSQNNPVSVNIAFFNVCAGCSLGEAELAGTGFDVWDDAGATSWLQTTVPVTGGDTFSIRYAIWDTGDSAWDSTVLLDSFEWIANGGTVSVGTTPTPQ